MRQYLPRLAGLLCLALLSTPLPGAARHIARAAAAADAPALALLGPPITEPEREGLGDATTL